MNQGSLFDTFRHPIPGLPGHIPYVFVDRPWVSFHRHPACHFTPLALLQPLWTAHYNLAIPPSPPSSNGTEKIQSP
jgi:hypothetical protein